MNFFSSLITFILGTVGYAGTINISNKLVIKSNSEKLILEAQEKSFKYLIHPSQAHFLGKNLYIYDISEESLENFIDEIKYDTGITIEIVNPNQLKVGSQDDMT